MAIKRLPAHLPSTIWERSSGLAASVCMTPESISPDRVSIGSSSENATDRKFAANRPITVRSARVICRSGNDVRGSLTMSRCAKNSAAEKNRMNASATSTAANTILRRRASANVRCAMVMMLCIVCSGSCLTERIPSGARCHVPSARRRFPIKRRGSYELRHWCRHSALAPGTWHLAPLGTSVRPRHPRHPRHHPGLSSSPITVTKRSSSDWRRGCTA